MPIEIKELIIRASIRDESEKTQESTATPSAAAKSDASKDEQIVSRCVEQVMKILSMKNER